MSAGDDNTAVSIHGMYQPRANLQKGHSGLKSYHLFVCIANNQLPQGKKPNAIEKVKEPMIKKIIEGCIEEAKENRYVILLLGLL